MYLNDRSTFLNLLTNFNNVDWIVVAQCVRALVLVSRIFPRLRNGAVVPNVALVREDVVHEAWSVVLLVLLDRIQRLFSRNLHLGVAPTRNLDHHVENLVRLVRIQWNVVPRRNQAFRTL